jgi:hypothetical protein
MQVIPGFIAYFEVSTPTSRNDTGKPKASDEVRAKLFITALKAILGYASK